MKTGFEVISPHLLSKNVFEFRCRSRLCDIQNDAAITKLLNYCPHDRAFKIYLKCHSKKGNSNTQNPSSARSCATSAPYLINHRGTRAI